MKLKNGDRVVVISGANKGKEGKIAHILDEKVIVEGVNLVKKHLKPKNNNGTGEIVEVEAPIHKSNIKKIASAEKKETKKSIKTVKAAKAAKEVKEAKVEKEVKEKKAKKSTKKDD